MLKDLAYTCDPSTWFPAIEGIQECMEAQTVDPNSLKTPTHPHPGSRPGPTKGSDPLGSPLREVKDVGGACTYQPSSWLLTGWRGQPIRWQNASGESQKSLSCPGCCDGVLVPSPAELVQQ